MLLPSLLRRRLFSSIAAATATARHVSPLTFPDAWAPAAVSHLSPATSDHTLFHLSLDLSSHHSVAARHVSPGQFLPLRLPSSSSSPDVAPPLLLSIASPPHVAQLDARLELLVKRVPGSMSDVLCGMSEGDVVEVGEVMGNGFQVHRLTSEDSLVLMFATGSGISPIRSLIESGFNQNLNQNAQLRLFYGARNLHRMAYQDRFKYWESCGVKVIPVLSRPDDGWTGARGYVQATFSREKQILKPSTGAILCGHRQMTQEITSILLANGVSKEKILTNF